MALADLARVVADELGASLEAEDGVFFLTVGVADDDVAVDDEDATQIVMLTADEAGATAIASCDVGPVDDELDLGAVLRGLASVTYSRVYLEEGDEETDDEHLVVEACVPLQGLDAPRLAEVVQEVAEVADWLDELLVDAERE